VERARQSLARDHVRALVQGLSEGPLNILMIDSHAEIERGGAIQCARLAAALAERGHRVTCIFDQAVDRSERRGAEWNRLAKAGVRILRQPLRNPLAMRRFRRTLDELRPDIVHTHKNRALHFLAGATLNRRSFGWVANRGTEYSLLREPPAWAIHRFWVDRIIPVADAVKRRLIRDGILVEKLQTIYGSFDAERFDPSVADGGKLRAQWGIPAGAPLVGIAASFRSAKKGQRDFLNAAPKVLEEHPDAHFVLAGDGSPDRGKALAQSLGISDRAHFPGFATDMPAALAAMDVVVCASRRGEGLTGSVREALAMARPVVSTDVAGNRELVRDGETGLLTRPRDASALAAAISKLLSDRKLAVKVGKKGRNLVVELCTDEVRAAYVEQLYRDVIAERAGQSR
jgi:glycosyltransferase involved in cell wall biosynthesis